MHKHEFEGGTVSDETNNSDCIYLKSIVRRPKTYGYLSKSVAPDPFMGKRLKMSARMKTDLPNNSYAQLWLRVDGDWKKCPPKCFDNMYNRRVRGKTNWTIYEIIIDVPKAKSTAIVFGVLIAGECTGQIWMADLALETVAADYVIQTEADDSFDWFVSREAYEGSIVPDENSNGDCVYFKSTVPQPKDYGYLSKTLEADAFIGKRLKMSARIKTDLAKGSHAQLWLRVDGNWKKRPEGTFDNMQERRVNGKTKWATYEVAVDVPKASREIVYGLILNKKGKVWMADLKLEPMEIKTRGKKKK